jgi:hypothetical protein
MKTFIAFCFVGLAIFAACRPDKPPIVNKPIVIDTVRPPVVIVPPVIAPDTFAIGDGVEIYRALLDWKYITRYTRVFTTGTVLGDRLVFRYNDIKRYYQLVTPAGDRRIAFEMNKKIFTGFSQESSVLGKAFTSPLEASDTGFVVTLNKEPIYFAYYRSRSFANIYEQNLAFVRVEDKKFYNQLQENTLPVLWDSTYTVGQYVLRPEPDPRYDKRLLDRLKKDGKLGF